MFASHVVLVSTLKLSGFTSDELTKFINDRATKINYLLSGSSQTTNTLRRPTSFSSSWVLPFSPAATTELGQKYS